jgi:arylsulfatase A-like enzyme
VRYGRAIRGGVTSDMPISLVDLMPTLLSLAGVPAPPGVQGRDLSQQWLRGTGPRSESIYCQGRLGTPEEWRMVVRGLDKLVVDRELKVTYLFNLGQDPYERNNLAREPAFARTRDEMTAILRDWMQRLGDRILPSGLRLRG